MPGRPSAAPRAVGPGLPPGCGARAKGGILGSLPPPQTRDPGGYYGPPPNRVWPLMAALLGAPAPARDDLAATRALIVDHGLAVWDVVCRCTIAGASDASIRDVVHHALPELAARLGVQAVF